MSLSTIFTCSLAIMASFVAIAPAFSESETDAPPIVPRFEGDECWFNIDENDRDDRTIRCGRLIVPENWDDPHSTPITLPVVRFSARGDAATGEPVISLLGGPNQRASLHDADGVQRSWINDLKDQVWTDWHDVVVITPRGSNWTDSNLDCPELQDPRILLGAAGRSGAQVDWQTTYWPAFAACIERLKRGHDVHGYSVKQMTRDVLALAEEAEFEEWSLLGVSFGTRIALEVMRTEPAGLQKVILDSVLPPGVNVFDDEPFIVDRALQRVFLTCKGDWQCSRDFLDPNASLTNAIADLTDNERSTWIRDNRSFGKVYYNVLPDHLITRLIGSLYAPDLLGEIPWILSEVATGNMYPIGIDHLKQVQPPFLFANAAFDLTYCSFAFDDFPEIDWDRLAADYPLYESLIRTREQYIPYCADWQAAEQDSAEEAPVISDIPTLVLNGFFDPVTPPEYAEQVAATLSNAHLFIFDRQGHSMLTESPCARTVTTAFMLNQSERPEIDCTLLDPKIVFKRPTSEDE